MRYLVVSKKRIYYSSNGGIENSIPRDYHLSSLDKPRDAKWQSLGRIFLSQPHTYELFLLPLKLWTARKLICRKNS